MNLIIGLGNPGKEYKNTRHNLGFLVVGYLKKNLNFPDFVFYKKFQAKISKGFYNEKKVFLVKPLTFMNRSGYCLRLLLDYYKLPKSNLWVILDDINLPLGTVRIRKLGSSGGHRGLQSIIDELGTKEFPRIRIGIRPLSNSKLQTAKSLDKFVLEKFSKEETQVVKELVKLTSNIIIGMLKNGLEEKTIRRREISK